MENPSDFVEPYFTKKTPELLVIVSYSVNFVKKTLDFVKMILKSINFMKNPLNFFSNRPVLRRRQIYQITHAVYQFYENPPDFLQFNFLK